MADERREEWRNLYRAAMLETDMEKFRQRVGKAQRAIIQRLKELERDGAGTAADRLALTDALQDLVVLSKGGSGYGW